MKKLIQYYDSQKSNKLKLEDLAIYLYSAIPEHIANFGENNVAIYMDKESKETLKTMGIDHHCIKYNFQPLDNQCHSMRWLSIMAMQTESFQILPLDKKSVKKDGNYLMVGVLQKLDNNPVLFKYNIPQTGGIIGGDTLAIPDASITRDAYCDAREIIQENDITDENEIANLMGAFLYKSAIDKGIEIVKNV